MFILFSITSSEFNGIIIKPATSIFVLGELTCRVPLKCLLIKTRRDCIIKIFFKVKDNGKYLPVAMNLITVSELTNLNKEFIFILFIFVVSYMIMFYIDTDGINRLSLSVIPFLLSLGAGRSHKEHLLFI